MKFKAEQFEAEVTEVGNDQWVIVAQGAKPKSLRLNYMRDQLQFLTDRGWEVLCDDIEHLHEGIALAISLLYSVPGVEYVDEAYALFVDDARAREESTAVPPPPGACYEVLESKDGTGMVAISRTEMRLSTDGGLTWTLIANRDGGCAWAGVPSSPEPVRCVGRTSAEVARSFDEVLESRDASVMIGIQGDELFLSRDGGGVWEAMK